MKTLKPSASHVSSVSARISNFSTGQDQKEIYFNGHLIETYKDLVQHINLMSFDEAMGRMREVKNGKSDDFVPQEVDREFQNLIEQQRPAGEYY
jgi:hypothetical protein